MKRFSILIATLLIAGCSGMGMHRDSGTSGASAERSGTYMGGSQYAEDSIYGTMPGAYHGDPTKSLYFGD